MDERGYAKGRAKRAEILETAVTVFAEVGYRGASLRDIAARCGITHPGLKHHFPTKEALLLAVLERRDQTAQEIVAAGQASGAEQLRRLVAVVADNVTRPVTVELFTTMTAEATSSGHPAHEFFAQRYLRVLAQIAASYQAARDEGSLRAGIAPLEAARELVALMDGLQVQWLYHPDQVDMPTIIAHHLDNQLLPGFSPDQSGDRPPFGELR